MTIAIVFPGQGSQAVGMGQALAQAYRTAAETFEEIDDALSQNLSRLMAEGPADTLTLTENAQPALMAVSLAVVRVLAKDAGLPVERWASHAAGHSLGEYSALAATGALTVPDAARVLKARGRAMQAAVPVGQGAMAAVLGLDHDAVAAVAAEAAEGETCAIANDNSPGQIVISGHKAAVERAGVLAKARGAKLFKLLEVSAPFHCPLMRPAADEMAQVLSKTALSAPMLRIIANVTAAPETAPETLRELLVRQVTAPVRWRESMLHLAENGVDRLVEIGSGKVLSGLAKRIDPRLSAISVGTPEDVEALHKMLG